MAEVLTTTQFNGDQPALDPKQIVEPYIIAGQNYLVDAEGPYSTFGQTINNYTRIEESTLIQSFEIGSEFFLFTDTCVLAFSDTFNSYYPVYIYEVVASEYWPWTHAIVGGVHYFCRFEYGVIFYNPTTGYWGTVTGGGLPANPYFCREIEGRLVVVGSEAYAWSVIDDGTDFTTNIGTGTGAQSLNLVGGSAGRIPYGLFQLADGFAVATSKGVIKAEAIDSIAFSFRHYVLTRDIVPLDQFNAVQFQKDTIIMLTKNGMYTTSGRTPEIFDPLMSEYFTRILFPQIDLSVVGLLKIHYSDDKQLLFISVSENQTPFVYPYAHVLYLPNGKWGRFNRLHKSIGDFNLTKDPLTEDNLGFACLSTYLRIFLEYPISETPPSDASSVFFTDTILYPSRKQDDVLYAASFINVSAIDRNDFPSNTGLYNQATKLPEPPNNGTIDSFIDIGPYRIRSPEYNAFLNVFEYALVGMRPEPEFVEDVDEMELTGDVDEELLTGDYDEGYNLFSGTTYKMECIGTLDGKTVWNSQQEELTQEESEGGIQAYSGDVHGLYLFFRFSAQEENQSFHLKFLEPNINLGGIL